jgi:hypothetical protein
MNNISANKYVGQTEAWGYTYVLINITKQGQQQPIETNSSSLGCLKMSLSCKKIGILQH